MEKKKDATNTGREKNYVQTLKMAIALACIKNKPDHMSAADYTEQLCQDYLQQHQTCKDRLRSAENEILHLKQQLVFQSSLGHKTDFGSQTYMPTPPSTFGESQPMTDRVAIAMETSHQPMADGVTSCHMTESSSMIQNTVFLQSILNLQTVTKTPQITSVTLSTIQNSLSMVKQCIENETSSLSCVQAHVHVITKVLDSEQYVDLVQVVNCVMEIINCTLNSLLSKNHKSLQEAESHVQLLTSFCHVRIFEKMLKILMLKITDLSNHLRDVCLKKENIQFLPYWNANHLFSVLRNIIHKHKSVMSSDLVHRLSDTLDQSLLHLSDSFPLFAHAVWGVQETLNKALN